MEQFVFPLPEVSAELQDYVEARLNTDLPNEPFAKQNEALQQRYTGTRALPIYVITDPTTEAPEKVLRGALGKDRFLNFVRRVSTE